MPHPKVKISDNSGNEVGVTDNRLNVNAHLSATPDIDIGDVSLLLGGNAADTNVGAAGSNTLRVAIANSGVVNREDSPHSNTDYGIMPLAVRRDTLGSLASQEDDYTPLQVGAAGALYVTETSAAAMLTALEKIDDIQDTIYADDADFSLNSDKGIAVMGYHGSQSITSGDIGVISLTAAGQVKVYHSDVMVTNGS